MRILHVVGARPNFMKIAPLMAEMAKYPDEFEQILVHTGQHYDRNMSAIFFDELEMPTPDLNLEVGSASHAVQTGQIMIAFEKALQDFRPDWVVVPGDVNSTLACSLVASKMGVKIAHLEAGLRSFDRSMPEEINRTIADQLSDLLLTPSPDADMNLQREGICPRRIHFVGNIMIDTLVRLLPKAQARWPGLQKKYDLEEFILTTLHRPSNVDDPEALSRIFLSLCEVAKDLPVIFPIHPRTRHRLPSALLGKKPGTLHLVEPLGYLDFMAAEARAKLVMTDSGGVQEETTYLGVPCLTLRPNTERPTTIREGTNQLFDGLSGDLVRTIRAKVADSTNGDRTAPRFWDGKTAARIVEVFRSIRNPS